MERPENPSAIDYLSRVFAPGQIVTILVGASDIKHHRAEVVQRTRTLGLYEVRLLHGEWEGWCCERDAWQLEPVNAIDRLSEMVE